MLEFFKSRAGRQCLTIVALGAALWISGALLDVDSWLVTFMSRFENYGADKFVLALGIAGAMSFIYSVLRIADLRKEMQLRDAAQARADWTATHDHLTKLPNRYAFERKILPKPADKDGTIPDEAKGNVTIFSVDLDGFKKVNDLVGHKGGDVLLVELGRLPADLHLLVARLVVERAVVGLHRHGVELPSGRVENSELPAGKAITCWHVGPYDQLSQAHEGLRAHLTAKKLTPRGGCWEIYWTDPGMVPDPKKWRTQLFAPIE